MTFDFNKWLMIGEGESVDYGGYTFFGYDELPEPLKLVYSQKQWAWLTGAGRQYAMESMVYPDLEDDY